MGCASSTEAVPTAKDVAPVEKKRHEKSLTAGTEAMAVSSCTSHDGRTAPTPLATTTEETSLPRDADASPNRTTSGTIMVGACRVRYACHSRRGRDPDDAFKPNQDSYSVPPEGEGGAAAFFGVYDGHGPHGEPCSQFVQRRLPELVRKNATLKYPDGGMEQFQWPVHEAHLQTNVELRSSPIDDSSSGTTAISALLTPDGRILVSNVGDSRAILGTKSAGAFRAVPLSKDQTPYRPDEAARCKKAGARILTFGQIDPNAGGSDDDSEVEDPPRVWAPRGHYPGTAFTRSIGDSRAEPLGVCADPEQLTVKLTPNERVIVLASDGIFDVLDNQQVMDLMRPHFDQDPARACDFVVERSHQEWLLNEDCVDEASASYDDMTILCIVLDHDGGRTAPPTSTTDAVDIPQSKPPQQQAKREHMKRVRQKTLRHLEDMQE